ncbi:MAG: hypothetical protein ACYCQI_10350 [Gammaproteobacteria bacterium]
MQQRSIQEALTSASKTQELKQEAEIKSSLEKILSSNIKWREIGTNEEEVTRLINDNPEHAIDICNAIQTLHAAKDEKSPASLYLPEESWPSLLRSNVFKVIKENPKLAKSFCESLIKFSRIPDRQKLSAPSPYDLLNHDSILDSRIALLCRNPQYAMQLATSWAHAHESYFDNGNCFALLDDYPEIAVPLTQVYIDLYFRWDEFKKDVLRNRLHINEIVRFLQNLKKLACLRVSPVKLVLQHPEYAEKISRMMESDPDFFKYYTTCEKNIKLIFAIFPFLDNLDEWKADIVKNQSHIDHILFLIQAIEKLGFLTKQIAKLVLHHGNMAAEISRMMEQDPLYLQHGEKWEKEINSILNSLAKIEQGREQEATPVLRS